MRKLSVVAIPDGFSVSHTTLLRAALIFDEVYLDAHVPEAGSRETSGSSFQFNLKQWSPLLDHLAVLEEANIVRRPPLEEIPSHLVSSFSSTELSAALREAVADSMRQGTSLLAGYALTTIDTAGRELTPEEKLKVPVQRRYNMPAPQEFEDPKTELAICLHLCSVLEMLRLCSGTGTMPLVEHSHHAFLLAVLAEEFDEISARLGLELQSISSKEACLSMRVLEDSIPDIRPRDAEAVLGLREEMSAELESFRTEMGRLAVTIHSAPWDESFQEEVEALLARDVRPSLDTLKRRLAHPNRRIVKHLVSDWKTLLTGAGVPFATWLMAGASLPWAVLGGLSVGLGLAGAKAKVEEWSAQLESPFTFVLGANRRLGQRRRRESAAQPQH